MFREISDIVSESITIHLKGSVVKSTAKQKDFQSKIKMFRKKLQLLKESFIPTDKIIDTLERLFVTASSDIKHKGATYVERIYNYVDIIESVNNNEKNTQALLLHIEQTFSNYDQSSVKKLIEDTTLLIEEREKEKERAEKLLEQLSIEEYPPILIEKQYKDNPDATRMMHHIREFLEDGIDERNQTDGVDIKIEAKTNIHIRSDGYKGKKKGVMWTRFIKLKDVPTTDNRVIDTYLTASVILEDPKWVKEGEKKGTIESNPDFSMQGILPKPNRHNKIILSFSHHIIFPSKLDPTFKKSVIISVKHDISGKEGLPYLAKIHGLQLFDGTSNAVSVPQAIINQNYRKYAEEHKNYKDNLVEAEEKIFNIEESYARLIEKVNEDRERSTANIDKTIAKNTTYKSTEKAIADKDQEISDKEKEISDIKEVKERLKELENDFKVVENYRESKNKNKLKVPTKQQVKNFNEYSDLSEIDLVEKEKVLKTDLYTLETELIRLEDKKIAITEHLKNAVVRESINQKDLLIKEKNEKISRLYVPEPPIKIIFEEGVKKARYDDVIMLSFPMDVPITEDQSLQMLINDYNKQLEELAKKLPEKDEYKKTNYLKYGAEFSNYCNALSKIGIAAIRKKKLGTQERIKAEQKFEAEFDSDSNKSIQFKNFLDSKRETILKEESDIEAKIKAAEDKVKTAKAKIIKNSIDKARELIPGLEEIGQFILTDKNSNALPSLKWETDLYREIMLLFGLNYVSNENTKSKKVLQNAGRISVYKEAITTKAGEDKYKYTYTLLPKTVDYVEEEPPSETVDSLDALKESGNVEKQKKKEDKQHFQEIKDKRTRTELAEINRENKKRVAEFIEKGISFKEGPDGLMVKDIKNPYTAGDAYKGSDEDFKNLKESAEWADEAPKKRKKPNIKIEEE